MRLLQREDPYNELLPDVLISRRLLAAELPANVDLVLDLTCEFAAPGCLRGTQRYRCFPILDASIPPADQLRALEDELRSTDGTIYIHCAQGHGRTGLVAAALLLARGHAETATDAIRQIRRCRPKVRLNGCQRVLLDQIARTLAGVAPTDSKKSEPPRHEREQGRAGGC